MPRRLFGPLVAVACTVGLLGGAATAGAYPVLVLGPGGHAVVRENPFLPKVGLTPEPSPAPVPRGTPRAPAGVRAHAAASQVTIASTLTELRRAGAITASASARDHAILEAAIRTAARLRGTRALELYSILTNMHHMAVAGQLTPSRLPVLFLTLEHNRQWWSTGPLLTWGQRVQFAGSQLVWEYYPGQGIALQVLGSFGQADGLYTAGPASYGKLQQLMGELIPLAVHRAGALVWEYYFNFDGGRPPWVSAMAQGTALEALTRSYEAFHDPSYLSLAAQALPLFSAAPPAGVRIATARGTRYLQYSFAPATSIINAFLQSLIGLYDYARVSGNATAQRLFNDGNAEAMAEVPHFDTGGWSLYQPGEEDSLSYHQLVTGFLHELCSRTQADVYCTTADDFEADLRTPPALTLKTHRSRVGVLTDVHFWLSKESRVGIVETYKGATLFATSTELGYGSNSLGIPTPRHPGPYTVRLSATDLAGNFHRIVGTLEVAPAPRKRH
ncbi:MAG TPA: D-glucuronyl C5-epimerase family protein [Solirubrobacteraceae bacterium]|nr:D-glucuronyl C5-epimerase family protein [Solirubrobacteraceae bacterium]